MSDRARPLPRPGDGVIINGPGPHDWISRYETAALVTLAALPLAALTVWLLARWRGRLGWTSGSARRTSLVEVGIVYGTLPWIWLTMLPAGTSHVGHGTVSLVPLRDLDTMPDYQIIGNLLVFAAVGLLAPLRFRALASIPRILALAAGSSLLIETLQLVLHLGRVSSVDDVLLNTVGAGLAALASWPWWAPARARRRATPEAAPRRPTRRPVSARR
jgi:hypothetical protein